MILVKDWYQNSFKMCFWSSTSCLQEDFWTLQHGQQLYMNTISKQLKNKHTCVYKNDLGSKGNLLISFIKLSHAKFDGYVITVWCQSSTFLRAAEKRVLIIFVLSCSTSFPSKLPRSLTLVAPKSQFITADFHARYIRIHETVFSVYLSSFWVIKANSN